MYRKLTKLRRILDGTNRKIDVEKARIVAQNELTDKFLQSFFPHGAIPEQDMTGHKDYLQLETMYGMKKAMAFNTKSHRVDSAEPVYNMDESGVKIPYEPFPRINLYYLYRSSDAMRITTGVFVRESTREGYKVMADYTLLCRNCNKHFQNDPYGSDGDDEKSPKKDQNAPPAMGGDMGQQQPMQPQMPMPTEGKDTMKCDDCGNTGKMFYSESEVDDAHNKVSKEDKSPKKGFLKPDWKERRSMDKILSKSLTHGNPKNYWDTMQRKFFQDLIMFDDIILIFDYEYEIKNGKAIAGKMPIGMTRASPYMTYLVMDRSGRVSYTDDNKRVYVCPYPQHREVTKTIGEFEDPPLCEQHMIEMKPCAAMVGIIFGQWFNVIGHNTERTYFTEEEVFHDGQYFTQSDMYGYSIFYTVFEKLQSLGFGSEYINKYYNKMRPPKTFLFIPSSSPDQLIATFEKARQFAQTDPNNIMPMAKEPSSKGGRNDVQLINISGTIEEMRILEVDKHYRRIVGAMAGIPSLMSLDDADTSSHETPSEMIPHNRGIAAAQRKMNEIERRIWREKYGFQAYSTVLNGVETADEIRELQMKDMRMGYAQKAIAAGFKVRIDNDGNIVTSSEAINPPMGGGGMGGGAGGLGGQTSNGISEETKTDLDGQTKVNRPSDKGGKGAGSSASGQDTSMSNRGGN